MVKRRPTDAECMGRFSPWGLAESGTEHGEQAALFAWANRAMWVGVEAANNPDNWLPGMPVALATNVLDNNKLLPELAWLHAIPNGGERSRASAGNMKAEGVKSGVADIFWPVPRCMLDNGPGDEYHGLYIEMKRRNGKPGDVSDNQRKFRTFVLDQGYAWCWCRGWIEARDRLVAYARGEWKQEYETL